MDFTLRSSGEFWLAGQCFGTIMGCWCPSYGRPQTGSISHTSVLPAYNGDKGDYPRHRRLSPVSSLSPLTPNRGWKRDDETPTPLPPANIPADLPGIVRTEILRAVSAGGAPDPEVHRRIVAWAAAAAPNSLKAMRADLRIVAGYQARRLRAALPLAPVDLCLLLGERAIAGSAKASLSRLVASMSRLHSLAGFPSCLDDMVRMKLKEIRRSDNRQMRQARGLRLKGEVRDMGTEAAQPLSVSSLLASIPGDQKGLRDRALISIAYDAGLRRSEVVRIRVEHIERLPTGEGSLFIPRSKTDQGGEGARA